jgi:hypothetical protein
MQGIDTVGEALAAYRAQWEPWLWLRLVTDAERELARLKIALIDAELAARS